MPSLPDGTTVNSQTVEGWNVVPPTGYNLQHSEGWDIDPPPKSGVSVVSDPQTLKPGKSTLVLGTATQNGDPATDDITIEVTHPDGSTDTYTVSPDSNGDYSKDVGPLEQIGSHVATSYIYGIEKVHSEGWNA